MCRNIRTLFNFEPPATDDEVHDAALQFVRKLSGSTKPSKRNAAAFERAVEQVAVAVHELVGALETSQPPRNREEEAAKARLRSAARFSQPKGKIDTAGTTS
ncbi:DUF2277 domain-containing protein [Pelagibius sp. Alg239-R121]|uniref:DUF2277 domain-containing protein n=1 Tax=Pelagibius sp. Alg239-R121 TaxID=2993448 RepID=UPI0024A70FE6|nr:DUF2277 domain-containing protein [Pelagibius sp. Alg239-R121]